MAALPSVRATLAERFLFNFRMPPESLANFLPPVPWLVPQSINGYGVVSFCLLDLRNITVAPLPTVAGAPLPTVAGLTSISCAPRYAVLDISQDLPSPAVFVTERQTNSAFGAWFTSLGFSAPHPYVEVDIRQENDDTKLHINESNASAFSASVRPTQEVQSELFSSAIAFAAFIAQGVSSYGLSRHCGRLTKMDLHKEDADYEPLEARYVHGPLVEQWQAAGAVFDSAFRTSGGRYEWSYHGLTEGSKG